MHAGKCSSVVRIPIKAVGRVSILNLIDYFQKCDKQLVNEYLLIACNLLDAVELLCHVLNFLSIPHWTHWIPDLGMVRGFQATPRSFWDLSCGSRA